VDSQETDSGVAEVTPEPEPVPVKPEWRYMTDDEDREMYGPVENCS
jgi:hypothetical protein